MGISRFNSRARGTDTAAPRLFGDRRFEAVTGAAAAHIDYDPLALIGGA